MFSDDKNTLQRKMILTNNFNPVSKINVTLNGLKVHSKTMKYVLFKNILNIFVSTKTIIYDPILFF